MLNRTHFGEGEWVAGPGSPRQRLSEGDGRAPGRPIPLPHQHPSGQNHTKYIQINYDRIQSSNNS